MGSVQLIQNRMRALLYTCITVNLQFQVALSCIIWVFPELQSGKVPDFASECCKEKSLGGVLYSFFDWNIDATEEFDCNSNCVYSTEEAPDSRYCFRNGGDLQPECKSSEIVKWNEGMQPTYRCVTPDSNVKFESDQTSQVCKTGTDECGETPYIFTSRSFGTYNFSFPGSDVSDAVIVVADNCTCALVGEDSPGWSNSLATVKHDLEKVVKDSSHPANTIKAIMEAFFKLDFLVLSKSQEEILFYSEPCSDVSIDCRLCLDFLLEATVICIEGCNNNSCEEKKNSAEKVCKTCLCDMKSACFPSAACPEDLSPEPTFNTPNNNPCKRECTTTKPKKCVFNFTLQMMHSGQDELALDGGGPRPVVAYNGQIPGPPIFICEGDEVVVHLTNGLSKIMTNIDGSDNTTTLHFHGIREKDRPWSDGVPHVTQCPILPGANFTYSFLAALYRGADPGTFTQSGTYWYHSHVGEQRTNGAYGALVIRPNKADIRRLYDFDNFEHTMLLQEWYKSPADRTIKSILINGKGRINSGSKTQYTEFKIEQPGKYIFRIIGAISEDVPLRFSIEGHTFTAIAADSQDIEPVYDLTDLWIASGERYHIVVQTNEDTNRQQDAYKIKVFGYANPNGPATGPARKSGPYCAIAWLKYTDQDADSTYFADCNSAEFMDPPLSPQRTLSPVPDQNTDWGARLIDWNNTQKPGNIFPVDLIATKQESSIDFFGQCLLNTHYIELKGQTFNGIRMSYDDVPILLQENLEDKSQCGTVCEYTTYPTKNLTYAMEHKYIVTDCSTNPPTTGCTANTACSCQQVLQQVYAPGYWTEIVLINNQLEETPAHPIHQHGGWYWVVGMGKFNQTINRTFIMEKDKDCVNVSYYVANQTYCLPRHLKFPPAKDTIQVPPGGYVILRTPTDNKGAWIMHCHINSHFREGMAMLYLVGGGLKGKIHSSSKRNMEGKMLLQGWCTGLLDKKERCPTRPSGQASINWYYGMEPAERCVAPGSVVTFQVDGHHNIVDILKEDYNDCNITSNVNSDGVFKWTAPDTETTAYLACGMYEGDHCRNGMKAKIHVRERCPR